MTDPQYPGLSTDTHNQVLTLSINRPERRNAFNDAVLRGLTHYIAQANADPAIRAIVITGVGDKAFCAGADLQSGASFAFDYAQPHLAMADLLRTAHRSQVPLIARVNGACMAGGMGLLAMCDLAIASPHATFGLPEVKVGLFPAQVASVLQRVIPRRMLAQLCLTGMPITADQAREAGLINSVSDALDQTLETLLQQLRCASPAAIRRGLYLLRHMESLHAEDAIAFAESQIGLFALTDDAQEGLLAFREKRQPAWMASAP